MEENKKPLNEEEIKEKKEKKSKNKSQKHSMFKTKAFRAGGYSTAAAAIVIVIAVVLNLIMSGISTAYTNIDTTTAGVYSLSEQTKDIVSSLEKEVTVYYIVSPDSKAEYVSNLLDKFRACGSNLKTEEIDPDINPNFASEYTDESVSNGDLLVVCGDKSAVVHYSDMIEYEAGSYEYYMYYLQNGQQTSVYWNGEVELIKAIDYVITTATYNVYFLQITGDEDFSLLTQALDNENIKCDTISLEGDEKIPDDASCLVVNVSDEDLTGEQYEAVNDYLSKGGKVYIAADYNSEERANLNKLMTAYGLSFTSATLNDGDRNYGSKELLYPAYTGEHAVISPFTKANYMCFPDAMGIETKETENITVTPLLVTSESGYLSTDDSDDIDFKTFNLGVVADDSSTGAQLIVYGTTAYTSSDYMENASYSNSDLFVNSIGYLCNKDSAISVHAKSITSDTTLDFGDTPTASLIFAIAVLPVFISLAVGITIWYRRKNS